MKLVVLITFIFAVTHPVLATRLTLELEDYVPKRMRMQRSGASKNYSVHLHRRQNITLSFCVDKTTTLSVENVDFSNDGPPDIVGVNLDGRELGTFKTADTTGKAGQGWNVFRSSGALLHTRVLNKGRHSLFFNATVSDRWGVELDNVVLTLSDYTIDYSTFRCENVVCFDQITYDDVPRKDSIPSGRFVRESVATSCSEQDNVKVQLYHKTAKNIEISAYPPKYVTFSNNREANYENCALAVPYWMFSNQTVLPRQKRAKNQHSTLVFGGSKNKTVLTITFTLNQIKQMREVDDRLIGTVLRVRLRNLPNKNVIVKPEYLKNRSWQPLKGIEFTAFDVEHFWKIPDRTWNIVKNNSLRLTIEPGEQNYVVVEFVRLDKRATSVETFDMFSDSEVVYQAARLGFWHHWDKQPQSMTVTVAENGKFKHEKVDSLRIYVNVPWIGAFAQVCVIFQDGRTRLQTMTPHGLDYIPFGSSVFIGQPNNANDDTPYSPIKSIKIYPKLYKLSLQYVDGNRADMYLKSSLTSTTLFVRNMVFKKDRNRFPLMTFKSMWVNDGNSDVDHVTINGAPSRHITSNWDTLHGNSAVFFRKCISKHNTQGPDIQLKIMSDTDLFELP